MRLVEGDHRIRVAQPHVRENKVYGDMFSNGSRTVRELQKKVQQVGASARERSLPPPRRGGAFRHRSRSAAQSVVTYKVSGQSLRYGELAADAAKVALAVEPRSRSPAQFTFIPRPLPRVDVVYKTDGSARFGIDARRRRSTFILFRVAARSGAARASRQRRRSPQRWQMRSLPLPASASVRCPSATTI